jgi:hypothetical protein
MPKSHKTHHMNRPARASATDQEIQKWVLRQDGFVPNSAWIAHVKHLCALARPGDHH